MTVETFEKANRLIEEIRVTENTIATITNSDYIDYISFRRQGNPFAVYLCEENQKELSSLLKNYFEGKLKILNKQLSDL